ncbi:MAG TPA: type II secretion system protein [Vicinamibacteria bacterium]|nr:type II secretion system protein [Vicinamibacteria bacterium]
MSERGFTLVEALVVLGIVLAMTAAALPSFVTSSAEAHLVAAGQQFKTQFRLAHSAAVRSGVYTAIRFERQDDGSVLYAVYADGNANGVRSADILSGADRLVSGPFPLWGGSPDVRVGINPGVPALPGDEGELSGDPIRFGRSDILSFSPLGTATPGTFYLAGDGAQAAVRVTGGSARVRLMIWRGGGWLER